MLKLSDKIGILIRKASLNRVLICTQGSLESVPPPDRNLIKPREMNMSDPVDIGLWLDINNDAFSRSWTHKDFIKRVLEHPHAQVTNTFFFLLDGEPVGIRSVGVFRRRQDIGVGHYLALRKNCQGRGLGKQIALHSWQLLRDRGVKIGESETTLNRTESIILHFTLGFRPKNCLEPWNSTDNSPRILKYLAWQKLHGMYREWKRRAVQSPA